MALHQEEVVGVGGFERNACCCCLGAPGGCWSQLLKEGCWSQLLKEGCWSLKKRTPVTPGSLHRAMHYLMIVEGEDGYLKLLRRFLHLYYPAAAGMSFTPILLLSSSNLGLDSPLVNKSAICNSPGSFDMATAAALSLKSNVPFLFKTPKSERIPLSQTACAAASDALMYSASAVLKATHFCLIEAHENIPLPKTLHHSFITELLQAGKIQMTKPSVPSPDLAVSSPLNSVSNRSQASFDLSAFTILVNISGITACWINPMALASFISRNLYLGVFGSAAPADLFFFIAGGILNPLLTIFQRSLALNKVTMRTFQYSKFDPSKIAIFRSVLGNVDVTSPIADDQTDLFPWKLCSNTLMIVEGEDGYLKVC